MAIKTDIEWCDSTLNLQMGCDGCELWNPAAGVKICYAGQLTERYGGKNAGFPAKFAEPLIYASRLEAALRWKDLTGTKRPEKPWLNGLPRIIFLNDMGDTFTESLPLDWLAEPQTIYGGRSLLDLMRESPHQFLLLTKRAKRMAEFSRQFPLPPNVWPGVSVTSTRTAGRIKGLLEVQGGGPRWLSLEPLLGPIDLIWSLGEARRELGFLNQRGTPSVQWAVVGGMRGQQPMHPEWARRIREDCLATEGEIAFFFKQWGDWLPITEVSETLASSLYRSNKKAGPNMDQAALDESYGRTCRVETCMLQFDGQRGCNGVGLFLPYQMFRVGAGVAGRELDGRTWSEMPSLVSAGV